MASRINPKSTLFRLCLELVALFHVFQMCEGGGNLEIQLIHFNSDCTEHFGTQECDLYFKICIDEPGPVDVNSCSYKQILQSTSSHYHNQNKIEFGNYVGNQEQPFVVSVDRFDSNQVMLVVEAIDKDMFTGDDSHVTMGNIASYTPAADKARASWKHVSYRKGGNQLWYKLRSYCNAYYYTTECDVFCKAHDDSEGHYTCTPGTGTKKCMRGWKGDNCDVDINECELGPCYHNAYCTNLPGSYSCDCPQGYTGQNCDLIDSMCHSSPCQNGGTCNGTMQNYTCSCPFDWTGENCDTQVDFCESSPCENNATCYATVGNYTCACALGWTGYHCTTEVDACDDSPCENGGGCTKLPKAQFDCACSEEYEGKQCQSLKDPCHPNPCDNSGTCAILTYDTYNCSCVYGWEGDTCDGYINITSGAQQQDEEEEGTHWVPVLISIISAIVIVTGVLILLYLRRRRRQKKEAEAHMMGQEIGAGVVQVVVDRDNIAFRNALYDETNRANSILESQTNRPPLPVPPPSCATTGLPDDLFNPTKPKVTLGEEQGAVGGANPYQDIDGYMEPAKCVGMEGAVGGTTEKDIKQTQAALDTRTMAGNHDYKNSRGVVDNPYADFEDLKRRSVAAREASALDKALPDTAEQVEDEMGENHYQLLDDVCLDLQTSDSHPIILLTPPPTITPPPTLPSPPTSLTSHYDRPRSDSDDLPPTPHDVTTAGYDVPPTASYSDDLPPTPHDVTTAGYDVPPTAGYLTPTETAVTPTGNDGGGGGYMNMAGSASREFDVESVESSSSSSSSEDEEEGGEQEDIEQLRREAVQKSSNRKSHA